MVSEKIRASKRCVNVNEENECQFAIIFLLFIIIITIDIDLSYLKDENKKNNKNERKLLSPAASFCDNSIVVVPPSCQ